MPSQPIGPRSEETGTAFSCHFLVSRLYFRINPRVRLDTYRLPASSSNATPDAPSGSGSLRRYFPLPTSMTRTCPSKNIPSVKANFLPSAEKVEFSKGCARAACPAVFQPPSPLTRKLIVLASHQA